MKVNWRVSGDSDGLLVGEYGSQVANAKVAAFDFDGTITLTRGPHIFSKSAEDWRFVHSTTRDKIVALSVGGYRIVIFTNQLGLMESLVGIDVEVFKGKAHQVFESLGVPILLLASVARDRYRKPDTGMWEHFVFFENGGIAPDMSASFYVGDAAGRGDEFIGKKKVKRRDHSRADLEFAHRAGLRFLVPEEYFC